MGKRVPAVVVHSAKAKHAELSGVVIVGEESARLLSEKLRREVKPGERFDLGVLAVYDSNPIKRFLGTFRASLRALGSPFAKPLAKE